MTIQKERLFIRGKIISTTPKRIGINQLPNPPIEIGITAKKIITKAWAVTITLYKWSFPINGPTFANSARINKLKPNPINPAKPPTKKYSVPISLWFVDINQRLKYVKADS